MNAIYVLITRDARGPSIRVIYVIGVALGIVVTVYLTWETLFRWPQFPTSGSFAYQCAIPALLILPAFVAAVSGTVTAQFARKIDFALLNTTPITPTEIVLGFIRGALYRNRVVMALSLPLLPLTAIGWLQQQIGSAYAIYSNCGGSCLEVITAYGTLFGMLDYTQIPAAAVSYLALFAFAWACTLPAAAIGVNLGLNNRNVVIAPITAFLLTVAGPLCPATAVGWLPFGYLRLDLIVVAYYLILLSFAAAAFWRTRSAVSKLHGDSKLGLDG